MSQNITMRVWKKNLYDNLEFSVCMAYSRHVCVVVPQLLYCCSIFLTKYQCMRNNIGFKFLKSKRQCSTQNHVRVRRAKFNDVYQFSKVRLSPALITKNQVPRDQSGLSSQTPEAEELLIVCVCVFSHLYYGPCTIIFALTFVI